MQPLKKPARKDLKGLKVLVTAGPTREHIDPVRFLSNPSTGQMGYALAAAAVQQGARVTLISGPVSLEKPQRVKLIPVVSAADMYRESVRAAKPADIIIMTAAVADYRPARSLQKKLKKEKRGKLKLHLVPTRDILQTLGKRKRRDQFLVGFAAETNALLKNARRKLEQKNLDLIIANRVKAGNAFGSMTNQVILIYSDGAVKSLPKMSKVRLATKLIDAIIQNRAM